MRDFKKEYNQLESAVIEQLKKLISKSDYVSEFVNEKALEINIDVGINEFIELTIINDKLTLINENGYHYSIDSIRLEDLIDLL